MTTNQTAAALVGCFFAGMAAVFCLAAIFTENTSYLWAATSMVVGSGVTLAGLLISCFRRKT